MYSPCKYDYECAGNAWMALACPPEGMRRLPPHWPPSAAAVCTECICIMGFRTLRLQRVRRCLRRRRLRDQMAAREESQAAGMFRAAARNEGFCFVSRGRCFDQSPDLISGDPAELKKKQNRKAPNPRLVFSRAPVIQKTKKQKTKQASQSNLNQRGLQV